MRLLEGGGGPDWGPLSGGSSRTGFAVLDVASGAGTWAAVPPDADDKRLVAWERVTSLEEPYRPRLVLVTIGSDKVVPLSGVREPDVGMSRHGWKPVFVER